MQIYRVLVVTGQPATLTILAPRLEASSCIVLGASDTPTALENARASTPDMIILDTPLPREDGLGLLRELRSFSHAPVVILGSSDGRVHETQWFGMGADDYMSRPFQVPELLARIEAIRRRQAPPSPSASVFTFGDVSLDVNAQHLFVDGIEKHLTRMEWQLMTELARNSGRLMVYEMLLVRAWGPRYRHDIKLLSVYMSRLRRKLQNGTDRNPIRNVSRTGYILG